VSLATDALARHSTLSVERVQVRFPLPIAGAFGADATAIVGHVEALDDCLYRAVANSPANGIVEALIEASHAEEPTRSRHVFWPMDNY
jgi:hypothetical protein